MTSERKLRVGSTFSGVGGADLGLERAGFELAWTCEWDEWKRSILHAHWPDVPHHGDIRDLARGVGDQCELQQSGSDGVPRTVGTADDAAALCGSVDLLVGGFPCQDLSVAGKRRGFDGERSVLAFEFLRVAESLRPRWLLMENVPGLLSSNGGRDLARLLDELGACGYGWAYRVLDARYFGVPQRRRRVFIVARRADAEFDSRAAAGLALRAVWEGSGGDPTPGWPPREITTASPGGSSESGRIVGTNGPADESVTGTLTRMYSEQSGQDYAGGAGVISFYPTGGSQNGFARTDGVSPTLKRGSTIGAESGTAIAYRKSKRAASDQDDETWVDDGAANTLNAFDAGDTRTTHAVLQQPVVDVASTLQGSGGSPRGQRNDAEGAAGGHLVPQVTSTLQAQHGRGFACNAEMAAGGQLIPQTYPIDDGRPVEKHQNGTGIGDNGAPAYTLDRQQRPAVAQAFTQNQREELRDLGEQAGALTGQGTHQQTYLREQMSVRRLTPIECERLMGWPDNWTAPDGVKAPDSKRYAACGDGIVSWVAYWIGMRIQMIESENE